MNGGKKTLTELQFSTNLIASNNISLLRKSKTKADQNISPNMTLNSRANMRQLKWKEYSSWDKNYVEIKKLMNAVWWQTAAETKLLKNNLRKHTVC